MNDLKSRLSYESYLADPEVRAGVPGRTDDPDSETWLPERLFLRLLALGEAYGLHVLGLVDSQADTTLNSVQCVGLVRELEFVTEATNDPALHFAAHGLLEVASHVARESLSLEFSPNSVNGRTHR